MEPREQIRQLSLARIGIGVVVLVMPSILVRWFAGIEATRNAKFLARLFASREIGLGLATLDAIDRDALSARVLEANMVVDGVDGLATLVAYSRLPRLVRALGLLGAAGAVALAGWARTRTS